MTEDKRTFNKASLFSKDEKIVIKAISDLRKQGEDKDLDALIELFSKSKSEQVIKLIVQFFGDLRSQASTTTIIELIKITTDKDTLKMLVSSCWQTRLNYINDFELFIDLIMGEEFVISFEAFTLLESFEEQTTQARKEELKSYVDSKIKSCKEENIVLASDLSQIIEDYKV